ncbi:hypothetical protein DFH09DRAFT_1098774 [Mycena vulgaris]|nr:hypothetical protein DFH09DRAFT_1098774 [Mycena vulgaris]
MFKENQSARTQEASFILPNPSCIRLEDAEGIVDCVGWTRIKQKEARWRWEQVERDGGGGESENVGADGRDGRGVVENAVARKRSGGGSAGKGRHAEECGGVGRRGRAGGAKHCEAGFIGSGRKCGQSGRLYPKFAECIGCGRHRSKGVGAGWAVCGRCGTLCCGEWEGVGGLNWRSFPAVGEIEGAEFGFNRQWERVWAVVGGGGRWCGTGVVGRGGLITRRGRISKRQKSLGIAHAIERSDRF